MELADVPDSKSGGSDTVRVRPPLPAPKTDELCVSLSVFIFSLWAFINYYEIPYLYIYYLHFSVYVLKCNRKNIFNIERKKKYEQVYAQ